MMILQFFGWCEWKKVVICKMIFDVVICLFFECGFDDVSICEVVDVVDVFLIIVFVYFLQKEVFVFDEDDEQCDCFVFVVCDCLFGSIINWVIYDFYVMELCVNVDEYGDEVICIFMCFLNEILVLCDYVVKMWFWYEDVLLEVIVDELGFDEFMVEICVYVWFILQMQLFVNESDDFFVMLEVGFVIFENGWVWVEVDFDDLVGVSFCEDVVVDF